MSEAISDLLLERYLASEVTPEQKQRIEAALLDASVAARLAALRVEREQFYTARSSEVTARAIAVRAAELQVHRALAPRPRWWAWLTPALATAAGVLLVFKMWSTLQTAKAPTPPASVAPPTIDAPSFAQPMMAPPLAQEKKGAASLERNDIGADKNAKSDDAFAARNDVSRFATPPPSAFGIAPANARRALPPAASPKKVASSPQDDAASPKPLAHGSVRGALAESQAEREPRPAPSSPAPPNAQVFDGASGPSATQHAASGRFSFSSSTARGGTKIGYHVDTSGFSVVISQRDDAPPQILADNSQHAVSRGNITLAPASSARHERLLLFVFSAPFSASDVLRSVNAGVAAAALSLNVTP